MKTNFHTHSTWCDGVNTPDEIVGEALRRGFARLGFSSHAAFPEKPCERGVLPPERGAAYAREIRALAARYAGRIALFCGVEAEYVAGAVTPDRSAYAAIAPDYVIGSVHFVVARDTARVPVDDTPERLAAGIREHFGGDAQAFVRAYFAAERDMAERCDFDVIGHPDLVRKFNARHPYFDEGAAWYRDELVRAADAFAASGKVVEVNTGAISRGWLDDAYPSVFFRRLLRERGVRFVLSSDAHAAATLDTAFDRFAVAEEYLTEIPRWKNP